MNVSDETLIEYVHAHLNAYRGLVDRLFPEIEPHRFLHARYPFHVTVVRLGPNGVIIAYRPSQTMDVTVVRYEDIHPPVPGPNIYDLARRLQAPYCFFSAVPCRYDANEAKARGTGDALQAILNHLWNVIHAGTFGELSRALLEAEGVETTQQKAEDALGFDAVGQVLIGEPGGFRRLERWAFEFRHHCDDRVSVQYLRQIEKRMASCGDELDVICLITSGDLTSLGSHIAVDNPRIRIWDRSVLSDLIQQHLEVCERYFGVYAHALKLLSEELAKGDKAADLTINRVEQFRTRLAQCLPGKNHFAEYEKICTDILEYLFRGSLEAPKVQRCTLDGKQRRDILLRNRRKTDFWQRLFQKFDADFIIVDSKNHAEPIASGAVRDAADYANQALGRFVLVVARNGAAAATAAEQLRLLRDRNILVVVASDRVLLEMIERKAGDQPPEDVLEDLVDEVLVNY